MPCHDVLKGYHAENLPVRKIEPCHVTIRGCSSKDDSEDYQQQQTRDFHNPATPFVYCISRGSRPSREKCDSYKTEKVPPYSADARAADPPAGH
jgi:hypothetical protein